MLVGNKCDLPNREVPYNVAMMFAKERNMGYLEVSAKTGANIFNTFNCLIRGTLSYNTNTSLEIYRNTAFYEEPAKKLDDRASRKPADDYDDDREELKSNLKEPKAKYMNKGSML